MKAKDIKIGDVYRVKVSGKLAEVRITATRPSGGWIGVNVATNREIFVKTAARLRYNVQQAEADYAAHA